MRYSEKEFDDIRPFNDSEFERELRYLLRTKGVENSINYFFKDKEEQVFMMDVVKSLKTVDELQEKVMIVMLQRIVDTSSAGMSDGGFDNIDVSKPCLYMSNHRDIVLDTGFLNLLVHRHKLPFTRTAIGSNLLINSWIEGVVKLNRSFVVKRGLPVREQLEASKHLSRYIRHSLVDAQCPVWLAQKEGRTKNGCDKTQASVLKMLNLSNESGSFTEGFRELNIVPLSISYEVEPCLTAKIDENILRDREEFEKAKEHDLAAMFNGIDQYKGYIHFECGVPVEINDKDFEGLNHKDALAKLSCLIDSQIYKNFKLFPFHYIAFDRLSSQSNNKDKYTDEDIQRFDSLLAENISKLSDYDADEVWAKFMQIYSNPVKNRNLIS
ncbi:MAG: hypothetical protein ACK5IQ_10325 [Bacteroidales bacterium]